MEYILGRPGPHPEFDGPEGMVRGADRPGPVFPRSTWPSLGAAFLATLGVTAALRAREVTGRGQWVETSLLQGALAAVALNWQRVENPDAPLYWMWPVDSRSIEGLFECSDGRWVHHWTVRPNWVHSVSQGDQLAVPDVDHKYRDDPDRIGMEADDLLVGQFLYPTLAETFRRFPSGEWSDIGAQSQMGVALVRSPGEALADPALLADGCVVEMDHPEHGRIRHVGNVVELAATPGGVQGPVAARGAHTDEVRAAARATRRTDAPASTLGRTPASPPLASPLEGLRVVDLGLGVAGPFAPKMLADLGADVIKVHALHDTFWAGTHMGLGTNRGKRSISVNLKDPRGNEILHRLVDRADVLATNWRPGAAARLGIDEASLRETHPGLVFCNTRGYERGPRSDLPGTDQTANALCGTEWEDGACESGNPPLWSRSGMGDTGNALLAAIGMTMALYHRERSGVGQAVGTSIVNACLLNTSYAWIHSGSDGRGDDLANWDHVDGDQWGLNARYRMYPTADGWVAIAVLDDGSWDALCGDGRRGLRASVVPTTAHSPRRSRRGSPAGRRSRRSRRSTPRGCRSRWSTRTSAVTCSTIPSCGPGVGSRRRPRATSAVSRIPVCSSTSRTHPAWCSRGPCLCGEHTREILRELGYSDAEIDTLAAERVVLDNADG